MVIDRLIDFLQSDLAVSTEGIALAQKNETLEPHILPIILWQYGLLDLQQLEQALDWLEIA